MKYLAGINYVSVGVAIESILQLTNISYKNLQVHWAGILRVASAYKPLFKSAILVMASVIPVHLLTVDLLHETGGRRKVNTTDERKRPFLDMQVSWEMEPRVQWTSRLIPNVRPWFESNHREVGYYTAQPLSGHGFISYLHKMDMFANPACFVARLSPIPQDT